MCPSRTANTVDPPADVGIAGHADASDESTHRHSQPAYPPRRGGTDAALRDDSNSMTTRKKLIEVALPLDKINAASADEQSSRQGHPSTLHLWWSRKPMATARAV